MLPGGEKSIFIAMKSPISIPKIVFSLLTLLLTAGVVVGQEAESKDERPDQFDIFKINVGQFFVNEARILYEMQVRPKGSVEFGLGFLYKNSFWFDQGGREMLSTGGAVYLGYRQYFVRKSVFYEPKILSYFSPMVFYRYSGYNDEWLLFPGGGEVDSQCERFNERIHQLGIVMRIGWQTRVGRLAVDMYGGLGFKWRPSTVTSTALNDSSMVCEIVPTTQFREVIEQENPVNVVLNAGVKIGIRRNNRERNFRIREKEVDPIREDLPDSPPEF